MTKTVKIQNWHATNGTMRYACNIPKQFVRELIGSGVVIEGKKAEFGLVNLGNRKMGIFIKIV
jgi:hypothetical protein